MRKITFQKFDAYEER